MEDQQIENEQADIITHIKKQRLDDKWDKPSTEQDVPKKAKSSRWDLAPVEVDTVSVKTSRFSDVRTEAGESVAAGSSSKWSDQIDSSVIKNPLAQAANANLINTPWQRDEYERNRPMTDEELNRILP